MDLRTKPRNVPGHRCTGLTYLPNAGERGYLGSKVTWGDIYKGEATRHLPSESFFLSLGLEGGKRVRFPLGLGEVLGGLLGIE